MAGNSKRWSGGCQCGKVRYRLKARPASACICHCRMCQKASGQPFMAFAKSPPQGLQWTRGAPVTFRSSSIVTRGFCRDCGTPLTFQYDGDDVFVLIGTLDQPSAVTPQFQCGIESRLPWCSTLPLPVSDTGVTPFVSYQHPDRDS